VRNTHRAIGTKLSSKITRRFGMAKLRPGHISVRLRGSAGQSLGAFAVQGLKLEMFGDANDYVGKGLSGGTIVVRPMTASPLVTQDNTIIGNTVLYGATAGKLFAAGQAAERFCVRNSGAIAVVEGCGSNGCEYMTGGRVVILGRTGRNFAAGMCGGLAYVLDVDGDFAKRVNPARVDLERLQPEDLDVVQQMIRKHHAYTQSERAREVLDKWEDCAPQFVKVHPRDLKVALASRLQEKSGDG